MYMCIFSSRDAFIFGDTLLDCFFTYVYALEQASAVKNGVKDILEEIYLTLKAQNLISDDVWENLDKGDNIQKVLKSLGMQIFEINEKTLNDINRELNFLYMINTGEKVKPFKNLDEFKEAFDNLKNRVLLVYKKER